ARGESPIPRARCRGGPGRRGSGSVGRPWLALLQAADDSGPASGTGGGASRSDVAVAALPVGFAQHALEDLAAGIAGDRFDEVDRAWALEVRDALAHEADDVVGLDRLAGLGHHDRLDLLAPLVVGHADDGPVGDRGVLHQDVLDLRRVDVLAARDDQVLDPVVQEQVAVAHVAGVAAAQPAGILAGPV